MFGLRSKHRVRAGSCLAVLGVAACSGQTSAPLSSLHGPQTTTAGTLSIPFPGAGNGGQAQVLLAGFTPNACTVAGPSASFDGGLVQVAGPDHVTCYFSSVSSAPMAFLEQSVETGEGQGRGDRLGRERRGRARGDAGSADGDARRPYGDARRPHGDARRSDGRGRAA